MPRPTRNSQDDPYGAWEERAYSMLTDEMRKRRVAYKELARLLGPFGIDELPDQLNRKVNRRRFSAAFLLVCMEALKKKPVLAAGPAEGVEAVFGVHRKR